MSTLSDFAPMDALRIDEEITDETVPDPVGYGVCGDYLLVRPVKTNTEKTKGGIYLPDSTRADVKYLYNVGRILDFGPLAYRTKEGKSIEWVKGGLKVGDIVQWERFGGRKIRYKGVNLTLLKDVAVQGVVDNQHDLDALTEIDVD